MSRAVVVHAHPRDDSFNHALFDIVRDGLSANHDVVPVDLYASGFDAVMSEEEWRAYHSEDPIVDPQVAGHAELVSSADLLAFVYPTWWFGPPAVMKGWLERVFVPGVGFCFDDGGRVRPNLTRLRTVVGVSTYGSSRARIALLGDGGRRMLTRALRLNVQGRLRRRWFGLYGIDGSTAGRREAFAARVAEEVGRL